MVHYDDTTDQEPYLENKQAAYEHMGLQREEDERQVIIDRSAGPGGTRSMSQPPIKYPPSPTRLVPPKRAQKSSKKSTTPIKRMAASNSTLSKTQSRRVPAKKAPMYLKTQTEVQSRSTVVPNLKSQQMKPQRSAVTMRTESKKSLAHSHITKSSRLAGTRSSVKRTSINTLKAEQSSPLRYSPKPVSSTSQSKLPAISSKPALTSSKKSLKKPAIGTQSDDEKIVFKEEPNTPERPTAQTPHLVGPKSEEVKQSTSSIKIVEQVDELPRRPPSEVKKSKEKETVEAQIVQDEEPEYGEDEFDFDEPSFDKPVQESSSIKQEVRQSIKKEEVKQEVVVKQEVKKQVQKEPQVKSEVKRPVVKKVVEENKEAPQEEEQEEDYDQDDFDMQSPTGEEYRKFTFEQPYSKEAKKPSVEQKKPQETKTEEYQRQEIKGEIQKKANEILKKAVESEEEEEYYEDEDFQKDMSKEKQPEQPKETEEEEEDEEDEGDLAKSTSTPQITAAGGGTEAQLASDSDEENDTQIEITKAFEMELPLEKLCNKKINYFNNDTEENVFQLHSSHPEFMGLKENEVTIGAQSQGKFQLRFQPVDEPADQQYVLFVLKNGQPWENILFSVSYKP